MRDIRGGDGLKVTIETDIKHRGNPRGSGEAKATIIFIDKNGSRHEREAAAAVENDTKNALTLQIVTAALRILNKPCDVELQLDNEYMQQVTEAINDFAKKLPEILDGMAKTIRAAVEQIDTEQLKEYLQQYEEGRNDTAAAIIELKEGKD